MTTITLTVGLPGSGKSTWAKAQQREDPDLVLVSLDEIRAMLFQSKFSKLNERFAVEIQADIINGAVLDGRSVIVHNTHLNPKAIQSLREGLDLMERFDIYSTLKIKSFLDVPIEVCHERNLGRSTSVPPDVINNMHRKWFKNGRWIGLDQKEISEFIIG